MIKFYENIKDSYINSGSYGIVVKCLRELVPQTKIMKNQSVFVEGALKINIKYKDEKLIGISSFKELSFFISLLNNNEETNVINLIDFIDNRSIKSIIEPILSVVKGGNKQEPDKIHFLFDYYEYDLNKYISIKKLNKETIILLTEDLWVGLYWCYLNDIVHRDLKLCNVLVKIDDNKEYCKCKICDFGLSGYLKKIKNMSLSTPKVTSELYRSPEVTREENYNCKMDYWAYGLILLNLITGEEKINLKVEKDEQKVVDNIVFGFKKKILSENKYENDFIEESFNLISNFLKIDVKERYDLKKMLKNTNFINKLKLKEKKKIFKNEILKKRNKENENYVSFLKERNYIYNYKEYFLKLRKEFILLCLYIIFKNPEWYKDEILYHSIFTFDRFIVFISSKKINVFESEYKNVYDTFLKPFEEEKKIELKSYFLYIFIYIFYKFFNTLKYIDWKSFVKEIKNEISEKVTKKIKTIFEELEFFVISEVFSYQIYEKTDFENQNFPLKLCEKVDKGEIEKILNFKFKGNLTEIEKYFLNEYFK